MTEIACDVRQVTFGRWKIPDSKPFVSGIILAVSITLEE